LQLSGGTLPETAMLLNFPGSDDISFGEVKPEIDALLQQGVVAYRSDFSRAEQFFRQALAAEPEELASYFCLYKIHTYHGDLDAALDMAQTGLRKAAAQAGWPQDWRLWTPQNPFPESAGRFALYTLKALSFIHLRRDEMDSAQEMLNALRRLDPEGKVGWPVIAALCEGILG
jgi:tetratricopeptide (TPR) repeat protein